MSSVNDQRSVLVLMKKGKINVQSVSVITKVDKTLFKLRKVVNLLMSKY